MFHVAHTSSTVGETPGSRLFKIRVACGTERKPESLRDFARRVFHQTGQSYDPTTISLLERMEQGWRLDDVRAFAAVDPLERGEVWLSALGLTEGGVENIGPLRTYYGEQMPEPVAKPAKRTNRRR